MRRSCGGASLLRPHPRQCSVVDRVLAEKEVGLLRQYDDVGSDPRSIEGVAQWIERIAHRHDVAEPEPIPEYVARREAAIGLEWREDLHARGAFHPERE